MARRAIWLSSLLVGLGCQPEPVELFTVEGVDCEQIEPGQRIGALGDDFPAGRPATLRIEGELYRPGAEPTHRAVELRGRAVSARRVEATISPDAIHALGGVGTLRGQVVVIFSAASESGGPPALHGRSPPVALDIIGRDAAIGMSSAQRAEARRGISEIGFEVAFEREATRGIVVTTVRAASAAERAGLRPNDVIVSAGHVRVHRVTDLLPDREADSVRLEVLRDRATDPFVIEVPWRAEATTSAVSRGWIVASGFGVSWIFLALVIVGPFRRYLHPGDPAHQLRYASA